MILRITQFAESKSDSYCKRTCQNTTVVFFLNWLENALIDVFLDPKNSVNGVVANQGVELGKEVVLMDGSQK